MSDAVREAFICDAVRTPIGRFGGALAGVRADDLAASPIRALMARQPRAEASYSSGGRDSADMRVSPGLASSVSG